MPFAGIDTDKSPRAPARSTAGDLRELALQASMRQIEEHVSVSQSYQEPIDGGGASASVGGPPLGSDLEGDN